MFANRICLPSTTVAALGFAALAATALLWPAAAHTPSLAQAGKEEIADLQWRFTVPAFAEQSSELMQTMKVMGATVTQQEATTFWLRWTASEDKKGARSIAAHVLGVRKAMDFGGNRIAFDSTAKVNPMGPLAVHCQALLGKDFLLKLGPQGTLTGNDFKPEAEWLFAGLLGKTGGVKKGDRWTANVDVDIGTAGRCPLTFEYTYQGKEGKLDKLTLKVTAGGPAVPGKSPDFTVKKLEPTKREGNGVILFDRASGRVVSYTGAIRVEATLIVEVAGLEITAEVVQNINTKGKVGDSNPLK